MTPYIELETCSVVAVGICWLDTSSIFLSLLLGHVPPGLGPWWQSDPLTVWPGQGQCQCCNPLASGQLTHMGQRQQEKCRFSTFWRIAATHCPPRAIHYWQQLCVGAEIQAAFSSNPDTKAANKIICREYLVAPPSIRSSLCSHEIIHLQQIIIVTHPVFIEILFFNSWQHE